MLRAGGHRVTRPRTAVWGALTDAGGHMTAEEVADRVAEQDDDVNLASIYRTLTLFEELDLVRQSRLGDNPVGRWELTHPDEHFHLLCTECGAVDHHVGTLVKAIRDHLASGHAFAAEQIDLTVRGLCATCAATV